MFVRYPAHQAARTPVTGAVLVALALLGGCSGDDEPSAGSSPSATPTPTTEARTDCQAEVELTGAVDKSWSGEGFVITENNDNPVLYQAASGRTQLTLFGEAGDFPAMAQVRAGKGSWTSQEGKVEVADDGSGAEIDAVATGTDGHDRVDVVATFTCG